MEERIYQRILKCFDINLKTGEVRVLTNSKAYGIFVNKKGYIQLRFFYRGTLRHRVLHKIIFRGVYGGPKTGMTIHHKDGNKLNNSAKNLICLSVNEHNQLHKEV